MESFRPLHDLTKKMETGEVTEKDVQDTMTAVKEDLNKKFAYNPEKLQAIHKRLEALEALWKEKVSALKAAKEADRQKIIGETKDKLAEVELEAGKQLTVPDTSGENRLRTIQEEKKTLQGSLKKEKASWTIKKSGKINIVSLGLSLADVDVKSFVTESFKTPKIAETLTYTGINDDNNKEELAAALEVVAKEFIDNGGSINNLNIAKPLIDLLNNLRDLYEKNKNQPNFPYKSPNEMLRGFSDFTQTNFINSEGKVQKDQLVTFMRYSGETFKLFFDKFKLYMGLLQEEKTLMAAAAPPPKPQQSGKVDGSNVPPSAKAETKTPDTPARAATLPATQAAALLLAGSLPEDKDLGGLIDRYCSKIEDITTREKVRARLWSHLDQENKKSAYKEDELKKYLKEVLMVDLGSDEALKKLKIDDSKDTESEARKEKIKKFIDGKIKNGASKEENRARYEDYMLGVVHGMGPTLEKLGKMDEYLEEVYKNVQPKEWKDVIDTSFSAANISPEAKSFLESERARLYVSGLIESVNPEHSYKGLKVIVEGTRKDFTDVYREYVTKKMNDIGQRIGDFKKNGGNANEEYLMGILQNKKEGIKTPEQYWNELWEKAAVAAIGTAEAQKPPIENHAPPPPPPSAPPPSPPSAEGQPATGVAQAPPTGGEQQQGEPPPVTAATMEKSLLSTGDPETDKMIKIFLPILANLFPSLVPTLNLFGANIEVEFGGLESKERRQGIKMKEAMQKMELNLDTIKPLFLDSKEMKRVIKAEQEMKPRPSWDKFLKMQLSPGEIQELKGSGTLSSKDIADKIISDESGVEGSPNA